MFYGTTEQHIETWTKNGARKSKKKRHLIYFKMAANEKIGPIPVL